MDSRRDTEILVVDDEPFSCDFISSTLRDHGYPVTTAPSGEVAMDLIRERHFPVIVSDMRMEAADGLELLAFINGLAKRSAVIFVTGHGSLDTAVRAIHEGAFDYISKPLDLYAIRGEIQTKVDRAVEHLRALSGDLLREEAPHGSASGKLIGGSASIIEVYKMIAKSWSPGRSTRTARAGAGSGSRSTAAR
jgi:DNA-binding NtrC family response regulator